MRKIYWVKQANIPNANEFLQYIKTVIPWLLSAGGKIIAKDIRQNSDLREWDGGQVGIIVEFETKDAARQAFNSREFQNYLNSKKIRQELSLSIISHAFNYK